MGPHKKVPRICSTSVTYFVARARNGRLRIAHNARDMSNMFPYYASCTAANTIVTLVGSVWIVRVNLMIVTRVLHCLSCVFHSCVNNSAPNYN